MFLWLPHIYPHCFTYMYSYSHSAYLFRSSFILSLPLSIYPSKVSLCISSSVFVCLSLSRSLFYFAVVLSLGFSLPFALSCFVLALSLSGIVSTSCSILLFSRPVSLALCLYNSGFGLFVSSWLGVLRLWDFERFECGFWGE